jgi:hypothetical protein
LLNKPHLDSEPNEQEEPTDTLSKFWIEKLSDERTMELLNLTFENATHSSLPMLPPSSKPTRTKISDHQQNC